MLKRELFWVYWERAQLAIKVIKARSNRSQKSAKTLWHQVVEMVKSSCTISDSKLGMQTQLANMFSLNRSLTSPTLTLIEEELKVSNFRHHRSQDLQLMEQIQTLTLLFLVNRRRSSSLSLILGWRWINLTTESKTTNSKWKSPFYARSILIFMETKIKRLEMLVWGMIKDQID